MLFRLGLRPWKTPYWTSDLPWQTRGRWLGLCAKMDNLLLQRRGVLTVNDLVLWFLRRCFLVLLSGLRHTRTRRDIGHGSGITISPPTPAGRPVLHDLEGDIVFVVAVREAMWRTKPSAFAGSKRKTRRAVGVLRHIVDNEVVGVFVARHGVDEQQCRSHVDEGTSRLGRREARH